MGARPDDVFARLDALGIGHRTVGHEPVFTVEESRRARGVIEGGHCKNLFLKNKRNEYWLVVCLEDTAVDLKALGTLIGAGRVSFASAERLADALGVPPGSVTPFALINDSGCRVRPVLQQRMLEVSPLSYHPLRNDMTTTIAAGDLIRFVESCGHTPRIENF